MSEEKKEGVEVVSGEVAKYNNSFNSIPLKNLTLVQKKILMTLIWMIKDTDGSEITMNYDRFIELTQSKPKSFSDGVRLIRQTFNKILSLSIAEIESEQYYEGFVLFTRRRIDKKTGEISVQVNPDYFYLIKDFANEYTKMPLAISNSFERQYTIDIYKFLRQYADTGMWFVKVEDFKRYVGVPDNYGVAKVREKVINPSLEELKKHYKELSFVEVYAKKKKGERGRRKVSSYRFFFTKEKREQWENDKFLEKLNQGKETNVPKWSNPDYKNETPEETKVELEAKKQELLARLNKDVDEGLEKLNNAEPYKK
ncbi:replication initiation protein [Streptococcus sp. CL9.43]|uniref:replication initiation protein n=1 Tax=Streptococcus sp. CL9.43 TaxID=3392238 RepID=UPI003C7CEDEE